MSREEAIIAEALALEHTFAREEICRICSVDPHRFQEYLDYEVISPCDRSGQRFDPTQLSRIRRARRLQRDFELNTAGVALALQLLETVSRLEAEVTRLNGQFR